MAIHTTESVVPDPRAFESEMVVEKIKRHKSPGMDEIPAELIKAQGRTIHSEIHKLINLLVIRRICLRGERIR
jgi:hypothetical protein